MTKDIEELCLEIFLGNTYDSSEKRNLDNYKLLSSRSRSKIRKDFDDLSISNKVKHILPEDWANETIDYVKENFNLTRGKNAIKTLADGLGPAYKLIVKLGSNSNLSIIDKFDVNKNLSAFSWLSPKGSYSGGKAGKWSSGAMASRGLNLNGNKITIFQEEIMGMLRLVKIAKNAFYLQVNQKTNRNKLPRNVFLIGCTRDEYTKNIGPNMTLLNETLEKIIQSDLGSADYPD